MPYHSPLHIFDGKNLSGVDEASLKRLKKELLLQFDLQQQTTIRLNGQEYDKASLLAAFDELKTDAEFHLRLYRNKDLLNFLEKGEVRFFENKKNRVDWNDPVFWSWVEPFFIEKLGDTIFECVMVKGFTSINRLRAIKISEFQLPPDKKDQAYAKTFAHFDFFFTSGLLKILVPFTKNSDSVFKKDTLEYLHLHHINVLKELPREIFQPVITAYGQLANHILGKTFYRSRSLSDFSRETLRNLHNATQISLFNNPEDRQIKRIAKSIHQELYKNKKLEGGSIWQVIASFVLMFIVFGPAMCPSKKQNGANESYGIPLTYTVFDYVSDVDLVGEWEATYFLGEDSIHVRRHFRFTEGHNGKMTLHLLDRSGSEQCRLDATFKWKVQGLSKPNGTQNARQKYLQFSYSQMPAFDRECQNQPDSPNAIAARTIINHIGIFRNFWVEPFTFDKSGYPPKMWLGHQIYDLK